jgi:TolA-binding protein
MPSRHSRWPALALALALAGLFVGVWTLPVVAQPAEDWSGFLTAIYDRHDEDLDTYLVGEVDRFLTVHPDAPQAGSALHIKARLLEQGRDEHLALLSWLRLAMVYPDHLQAAAARDEVIRIAAREGEYEDVLERLRSALDAPRAASATDRRFAFLELLAAIMHDDLEEPALGLYREFGRLAPDDPRQVRTLNWEARVLEAQGDEAEAAVTLEKAEQLFPAAPGIPAVMRHRALLLADDLDDPDAALAVLADLRTRFPDHPLAAEALREQARIRADEDDAAGALADLRTFVDTYPEDEHVVPALLEMAELAEDELKAWQRTDAILEEIVTRFPADPRSVEALRRSARLNQRRLEDDARAAAQYARVAALFPQAEDADRDLFRAAEIARDDLKDPALAAQYLQAVITTWPDSEPARKAQERLDDLREE